MGDEDDIRYYSYAAYMRKKLGGRVQKLSIDAGFTCPNRDGSKGSGGCTFCNNNAFNPSYCHGESQQALREVKPIDQQIAEGIKFHQWRYRNARRYLAYFQAYSNTYAPLEILKERYEAALRHPDVEGLVIGTRPDCVDEPLLDYLSDLAAKYYVTVEYGIESCYDRTLAAVHRGHDFAATERAIRLTSDRGIACGGHLIMGLPGESREDILAEAEMLNRLPLESIKLHQLQVLNETVLARQLERHEVEVHAFTLEEYIALVCDFVERLRPDIAIERFAGEVPPRFQALPDRAWRRADGRLVRNEEIAPLVNRELQRRGSRQGCSILNHET